MRRWIALFVFAAAGAGIVALVLPAEEDPPPVLWQPTQTQKPPRCPKPRVIDLTARRASENGYRIRLHVRAEAERARLGGFLLRWGDGSNGGVSFLLKGGGRRLSLPLSSHHYRKAGTYRIWLVAEAESPSCGDMRSEPATLRIRVPLTTSYPSSP